MWTALSSSRHYSRNIGYSRHTRFKLQERKVKNHRQIKELDLLNTKESILTCWVGKHCNGLCRKVSNGRILRNLREVNQALS